MRIVRSVTSLLAAGLLVAGCGVPLQDEPQVIERESASPTRTAAAAPTGNLDAVVYFIQGDRVIPVSRRLGSRDGSELLRSLFVGPAEAERQRGLRSAIPLGVEPARVERSGTVAIVELPAELADLGSPDHVLAVAQIVFTLTATDGARSVQLASSGQSTPAPAGDGRLVDRPLTRADFLQRAPETDVPSPTP